MEQSHFFHFILIRCLVFQDFGGVVDKEDINKDDLRELKSMLRECEILKYYDETW